MRLEEETLPLIEQKLGRDHPRTLQIRNNLAESYIEVGKTGEGCRMHDETLSLLKKKLGPEHPNTLSSMSNLANEYSLLGRNDEAVELLEQVSELQKRILPEHPETHWASLSLLDALLSAGKEEEAESIGAQVALGTLFQLAKFEGLMQLEILDGLQWGTTVWIEEGKLNDAASVTDRVVEIRKKSQGIQHPDTLEAMVFLADIHMKQAKYTEAEKLLIETSNVLASDDNVEKDNDTLQQAIRHLVRLYEKTKQPQKVAAWKKKLDKR